MRRRTAAMRTLQGRVATSHHCFFAAPALASLMQSLRNFLRSLPFKPFSSACLEHSTDSGLRCLAEVVFAGAGVAPGAGVVVDCAKAALAKMTEAKTAATARDVMVVMETPCEWIKGRQADAMMLNRG